MTIMRHPELNWTTRVDSETCW